MLMKTKTVDFHHVEEHHKDMDKRLHNWSRWVKPRAPSWVSPMFRMYRSNAWQYHKPEHRESCDMVDAMKLEKAVSKLPEKHREAIRWSYVFPVAPFKMQKSLGVTEQGLYDLKRSAVQMLINSGV